MKLFFWKRKPKNILSEDLVFFLLVVFIGILASRTLIFQPGYFLMHDDLQMMRQLQMEKCFKDFQIPCRWVPDMGYGYGFPLFNFYPPLPYLIGQIIRFFGFSFVFTVKFLFSISIILSGIGMYLLAKELFSFFSFKNNNYGALVSAAFYIFAPYHAVDVYVRGAMNESWALVFFPFAFFFSLKLMRSSPQAKLKWAVFLSLSWAGLFLSHNLMVMIFFVPFVLWCFLILFIKKDFKDIRYLLLSGSLALGLASFFTFPFLFENRFTWLRSQFTGYFDFSAHFATIKQLLFSRAWGYGPSVWLEEDGMSFQIGHLHWIISLIVFGSFLISLLKKKALKKEIFLVVLFFFFLGWFSSFLVHQRSIFFYKMFPALAYLQFPWRFLALVIFFFSLLDGFLIFILERKFLVRVFLGFILTLAVVVFNWNYFLPSGGKMGSLTDSEKFRGTAWELQQTAGIYDYLPIWAKEAPKSPKERLVEVVDEGGNILENDYVIDNERQGTNWAEFRYEGEEAFLRINIFMFPGWKVFQDGKEIDVFVPEVEKWGRMWIKVPAGEHRIDVRFFDTPVRTASNLFSLFSLIILIVLLLFYKKAIICLKKS